MDDIFDLAQKRLSYLEQRQEVLSHNIANANTPHWQARDLKPFAAFLEAGRSGGNLVRTNALHLAPSPPMPKSLAGGKPAERAPDGNAVSMDEQLMKVAETETSQELVTNLYTKYAGMFRTALGRGS